MRAMEKEASEAKFLAEASLMSKLDHRAPRPDEMAALSDSAVSHLAAELGLNQNTPKAAVLDALAERLGWRGWED